MTLDYDYDSGRESRARRLRREKSSVTPCGNQGERVRVFLGALSVAFDFSRAGA